MNLKFEISLLIFGGILRLLGVGWNVWYYFNADFSEKAIEYACGAFLIAPSAVFLIITITSALSDCFRCKFSKTHYKIIFGLLLTVGGPIGAPLFVYAGILALSNSATTGDFHIIEAISKVTSLIESLFESLPQIALQVYNNMQTNSWQEPLKIIPIIVSLLGISYTIYKICNSVDKIRQYENASTIKDLSANKIYPSTERSGNSKIYITAPNKVDENDYYDSPGRMNS